MTSAPINADRDELDDDFLLRLPYESEDEPCEELGGDSEGKMGIK